ncbi:MAG: sensor histidine kinase [Anaerolineae bacterium]
MVRTLFEVNSQIIQFVYGLSFFALGLAIALQSRRYSQLDLARSLPWLAAFGFTHSLNEWGDLFIPLQRAYMGEPEIAFLYVIQLFLLALSFTFLFEFGVQLLRLGDRTPLVHSIAGGLLLAWIIGVLLLSFNLAPDLVTWRREANALARYGIGFPGSLLAAYSLRQHAVRRIAPLNVPHIVRMLRVSGFALALYAVFGGLIAPSVPFFPGNWINNSTFEETLSVPPMVFRSIIGVILAIAIIRALEIFQVETQRFIESIEQQQILATERDRIARELHDGVIQKVYTAGLLIESVYKQAAPESVTGTRLDKALSILNDTIAALRRNLQELRPVLSGRSLYDALRALEKDARFGTLVDLSLALDLPADDTLAASRADEVMAIVIEALSNVVRHAHATRVHLKAFRENGDLKLMIQDDGVGLPRSLVAGYGLRNMRDRARMLGGQVAVTSTEGKGTTVTLDIPWSDAR